MPEHPEYAWFEGLVNAVTHRDYSIRGEYIRVYIYDDRMLIQSPGKLPNIVTIDNIRHARFSRNPVIARVFTAFEWVRELNEGVDKIYQEMAAAGLPEPEYESQDDYYLKLTLRNDLEHRIPHVRQKAARGEEGEITVGGTLEHGAKIPLTPSDLLGLSKNEIAAVEIAAQRGKVTTGVLAEEQGVTKRTASVVLKGLAQQGILAWHGTSGRDPHQYYEITPKEIS